MESSVSSKGSKRSLIRSHFTQIVSDNTNMCLWCHKNSWIYLPSTYYWWLLIPTITIPFDSKFQIIAQLFDSIRFEMKKRYLHSTTYLCCTVYSGIKGWNFTGAFMRDRPNYSLHLEYLLLLCIHVVTDRTCYFWELVVRVPYILAYKSLLHISRPPKKRVPVWSKIVDPCISRRWFLRTCTGKFTLYTYAF